MPSKKSGAPPSKRSSSTQSNRANGTAPPKTTPNTSAGAGSYKIPTFRVDHVATSTSGYDAPVAIPTQDYPNKKAPASKTSQSSTASNTSTQTPANRSAHNMMLAASTTIGTLAAPTKPATGDSPFAVGKLDGTGNTFVSPDQKATLDASVIYTRTMHNQISRSLCDLDRELHTLKTLMESKNTNIMAQLSRVSEMERILDSSKSWASTQSDSIAAFESDLATILQLPKDPPKKAPKKLPQGPR